MVISGESVDLDPTPEDLLTVWGQEVNAQTLRELLGKSEGHGAVKARGAASRAQSYAKVLLEESRDLSGNQGLAGQEDVDGFLGYAQNRRGSKGLVDSSGKPLSPSRIPYSSGGLEDIISSAQKVGIWRSVGGLKPPRREDGRNCNSAPVSRSLFPKFLPERITGIGGFDAGTEGKQGFGVNSERDEPLFGFEQNGKSAEGLADPLSGTAEADLGTRGRHESQAQNPGEQADETELRRVGIKRKKSKPLKTKSFAKLILGMDVQVEDVLDVAEVTLVGRIRGRPVSGKALRMWAEKLWAGTPASSFKSNVLVRGWFMVSFDSKEALEWVEGQNWAFGSRPIFFKRWTPLFDAETEKVDEFPVWVRAPSLPPFLWADSVFKSIGDLLGTYLDADRSYLHTFEKGVARILVRLNPKEGLAKTITLVYKEYEIEQKLDYELLPFRCHRCHEYGHLARDCPLGRRKRRTQKDDEEWMEFVKNAEYKADGKTGGDEVAEVMATRDEEEHPKDEDFQIRSSEDQPMMDGSGPAQDAVGGDEHPGNSMKKQTGFLKQVCNRLWALGG